MLANPRLLKMFSDVLVPPHPPVPPRVMRIIEFFLGRIAPVSFVFGAAVCEAQVRTLTVGSMPAYGVSVTTSPADLNGAIGSATAFSREYSNGAVVSLTAPALAGSNTFVKWQRNGVDFSTNRAASVTMNANYTMNAVYFSNPQVLSNPSFESDFTGWTVTGNALIKNSAPYSASNGAKLIAFNSAQSAANGVVTQSFPTNSGTTYTLAFDIGTFSFNTKEQRLQVSVDGSGNRLLRTEAISGTGSGLNSWAPRSFTFVANSAVTTLRFSDVSTTSDAIDLLLDNVRITGSAGGPSGAPIVANDSVQIHTGQKVLIPVLANDAGLINQSTLQLVSPPSIGTATAKPSGEILYAHSGNSTAPVTFSYQVSGEGGQSQIANVTVTFAQTLRIANNNINVPAEPPVSAVQIVPAFPGVSFTAPVCFASPPGDTKRLFVCELGGKVKVIPDVTAAAPTSSLVLDIPKLLTTPARVPAEVWNQGASLEAGLTGFAFHPNYANNGYIFISYLMKKSNDSQAWYARISRFTVPAAQIGSPAPVANPASEYIIIEQRDRHDGHNGSALQFGNDGYLYWSIGDEGLSRDGYKNSQRIDMNFFGGMLRIDVDKKPGNIEPNAHVNPTAAALGYSAVNAIPRDEVPAGSGNFRARYSIPIDNPFVATSKGGNWNGNFNGAAVAAASLPYVRSEFYAVGLRSPWRFFIDKPTGDIWLGDVGEATYEELNLITKGGNYGWAFREGAHAGPKTPTAGFSSIDPVYEYNHVAKSGDPSFKGNSIIGGVVYRGTRSPNLAGAYIFGDFISGNIWSLTRSGGVPNVKRIGGQATVSTFGTDPSNGDVLLSDMQGARIMRITTTSTATSTFPETLSATGLFSDLTDLSPAPGVLPYQPNLTFWSDHAVKRRWFAIPDGSSKMSWSRDGSWNFPSGQIWVKHFDLETERGNESSPKIRLETRIMVKNNGGMYGVSYKWNADGTEATLVPDAGEEFEVDVTVDGQPYTQLWNIPSRAQCITCHSPQAGHALSFNTRQLNLDNTIHDFSGNQLDLLKEHGYFSNTPEASTTLPRHVRPDETDKPLEARVRSYLAVNCSYCHAGAAGTAPTAWDGRHEVSLAQTGLIDGHSNVGGDGFKLIAPGDPDHSVVLLRMAASDGFTRMPPLGSNELDKVNLALVNEWISEFPAPQNNPPLAVTDSYSTLQETTLTIPSGGVLSNDSDPDSDNLTASIDALPSHGTVTLSPGGGFTYVPDAGYTGPDSFTYHANDGELDSNIVTVSLTVNEPVAGTIVNGSFELGFTGWTTSGNMTIQSASPYGATEGSNQVAFNSSQLAPNGVISQSFATAPGQTYTVAFDVGILSFTNKSQVLQVTADGSGNLLNQSISISRVGAPNLRWLARSFTFVANSALTTLTFRDLSTTSDGLDLLLDNVRVTSLVNTAPVAVTDSYQATMNAALTVAAPGVLGNDSDPEGSPLSAVLVTGPSNGSITLNANGGFTYSPTAGYTGTDSFTYRARDGALDSGVVTVNLTVNQVVTVSLVNGSFESGFDGWTRSGNMTVQSASPYAATDGTKLVAFNTGQTTPNGLLSQSFATVAGQTYRLTFDVGVLSFNKSTQSMRVSVTGSGTLLAQTISLARVGSTSVRWLPQTYTFVANSALTTLSFSDLSATSDSIDLTLDDVTVSVVTSAGSAPPPPVAVSSLVAEEGTSVIHAADIPVLSGTPGDFSITMMATKPGNYVLERSVDLSNWEQLSQMMLAEPGPLWFFDSSTPPDAGGKLFYRIGREEE